jgi:hypothetical protein
MCQRRIPHAPRQSARAADRGHGASQPDPRWEFRPVKRFPLVGDHPVAALVELVEHRMWGGVRRYRARLALSPHAIMLAG